LRLYDLKADFPKERRALAGILKLEIDGGESSDVPGAVAETA
jgi:hypothetical protein